MRILHVYLLISVAVFVYAAVAKLTSDFSLTVFNGRDPFISFLSVKSMLIVAASLEIIVSAFVLICLLRRSASSSANALHAIMWLFSLFLIYRIGMIFASSKLDACKCFGAGSMLSTPNGEVDFLVSVLLLGIMLVSGFLLLVVNRKLIAAKFSGAWVLGSGVGKTKSVTLFAVYFLLSDAIVTNSQDVRFNPAVID